MFYLVTNNLLWVLLTGNSTVDSFICNDSEQDLHEEGTGDLESLSDIDDVEVLYLYRIADPLQQEFSYAII